MKLRPEDLEQHLRGPLAPIYLLSGEEPLQLQEAADAIRSAARAAGYTEREVMQAEAGFDWAGLTAGAASMSLFGDRRIIDLRLAGARLNDGGSKALTDYAATPPEDTLLLVTAGKLDKKQQQARWFKALDKAGVVIQVWPVEPARLPGWIGGRMRRHGLVPDPEVPTLIAERVEGNLLAAAQEVEKLHLLIGSGQVDAATAAASVGDSARYSVFDLADAALLGDAPRVVRVIRGLREEGTEPVLTLWALSREIRALAAMAADQSAGMAPAAVMEKHRVWSKRKGPVGAALARHPAQRWRLLLQRAARVDRIIKGMEQGAPWDELIHLALLVAGTRIH